MSVSSIVGNTADDVDAKKVPWANIVCNSIYALNSRTKNVDAIDGVIENLTVQTINGEPPAIVGNTVSSGLELVT